jgi:hypothetical protein
MDSAEDVYFAVNPDLLDEKIWSYRQLQHLAKRVGVKANGSRAALVERLQQWHKNGIPAVDDEEDEDEENKPPVPPGEETNFHMLQVNVGKQKMLCASPRLLSPFGKSQRFESDCNTPSSILKSTPKRSNSNLGAENNELSASTKKRLEFSPYNKVALVPPRDRNDRYFLQFMRSAPQFTGEGDEDGEDEDSDDEEELEAARNAAENIKLTQKTEQDGSPCWGGDVGRSPVEQLVDVFKGVLSPQGSPVAAR